MVAALVQTTLRALVHRSARRARGPRGDPARRGRLPRRLRQLGPAPRPTRRARPRARCTQRALRPRPPGRRARARHVPLRRQRRARWRLGDETVDIDGPRAYGDQEWPALSPVTLVHTAVIERNQWRYRRARGYRDVLLGLGHVSQTILLLAAARGPRRRRSPPPSATRCSNPPRLRRHVRDRARRDRARPPGGADCAGRRRAGVAGVRSASGASAWASRRCSRRCRAPRRPCWRSPRCRSTRRARRRRGC